MLRGVSATTGILLLWPQLVSWSSCCDILTRPCWTGSAAFFANLCCSRDGLSYAVSDFNKPLNLLISDLSCASGDGTSNEHWSHTPVCTDVLASIDSRLCVYTNSDFADGRGISIFTTPLVAAQIAASFTHDTSTILSNPGGLGVFGIRGKGRGVLAGDNLKGGDILCKDLPLILFHGPEDLSPQEQNEYLQLAFSRLPSKTQKIFSNLTTISTNLVSSSLPVLEMMHRHGGAVVEIRGLVHMGLYPKTMTMNHGCIPNAQYYIDPPMTLTIRAMRDIARDEEVTVSYFDESWGLHFRPFAARQLALVEMFKSPCLCSLCQKGDSTDEALREIFILEQTLASNGKAGTAITTNEALRLIQLYEEEGLEAFIDIPYGYAALAFGAVGDFHTAISYTTLALESLGWRIRERHSHNIIWQQLFSNLGS